jgi:hypothetical protein
MGGIISGAIQVKGYKICAFRAPGFSGLMAVNTGAIYAYPNF